MIAASAARGIANRRGGRRRVTNPPVACRSMLTDPRRFSRIVAAVALILGPIVVLAGMIATPWEDEATTASYHDALAAHPGQAERRRARCCTSASCCCSRPRSGIMHLARRATPEARAHRRPARRHRPRHAARPARDRLLRPRAGAGAAARAVGRDRRRRRRRAGPPRVMGMSGVLPMFFGTRRRCVVAAWRAGVAQVLGAVRARRRLAAAVRVRHRASSRPSPARC